MSSRWYSVAVVVLWLASMTWLLTRKVLPPLLVGEPPSYHAVLATDGPSKPVGWNLSIGGDRIGWALNTIVHMPNETTQLRSRVRFDRIPLDRLIPGWLNVFLPVKNHAMIHMAVEAESVVTVDAMGQLVDIDSAVRLRSQTKAALRLKPSISVVRIRGTVDDNRLKLSVQAGDISWESDVVIQPEIMLGDHLSPQMRLPGLRAGQAWTVPSYSPLSLEAMSKPIDILYARVEELTPIVWNGQTEEVWLVVLRTDETGGGGRDKNVRSRLWVRPDGTVLRQQAVILDGTLMFNRMTDDQSRELRDRILAAEQEQPR